MIDACDVLKAGTGRQPNNAYFLMQIPEELRNPDGSVTDADGTVWDPSVAEAVVPVDGWDQAKLLYDHLGCGGFNDPTEIGINVFEIYPQLDLDEVCKKLGLIAVE